VKLTFALPLALLLGAHLAAAEPAAAPALRVYLLGTGGPELTPQRLGPCTVVEANGQLLLFDAGHGAMQRLYEARLKITSVTKVFFTHLHSDHIVGLPDLWITSWFLLGRSAPMEFRGPAGTARMLEGMKAFFAHDMTARVFGPDTAAGLQYSVTEHTHDGVIYQREGVVVTAFEVEHKDGNPAYGYRIAHGGHAVVLSGDCTLSPNLIAHAQVADVIVHNVFAVSAPVLAHDPVKRIVAAKLASPEQVAEVFQKTRPRLGVLSHIIRIDLQDEDVARRVRAAGYAGPLELGRDRMVIDIDAEITIAPPAALDDLPDAAKRGDS